MKRSLTLVVLSLALASAIWSETLVLDRETAVATALTNNPDLLKSGIVLSGAERENANTWNQFLPSFSVGTGLSGGSSLSEDSGNAFSWSVNASVNASLPLKAGLAYSIQAVRLAYENEQITYATARLSLIAQIETEFSYLLAGKTNISIEAANLDLARKRYEQALINYENGLGSELAVLQAEVSAANLEPTYLQAVADYEARKREFLLVLGLNPETEIALEGSLDVPVQSFDAQELANRYISQRHDIQALQQQMTILQNSRNLTTSNAYTPSLNLSAGWSTKIGDAFNAGSWNSNNWADGFALGLSLSMPLDGLIPGSSTDLNIKSIDDQIETLSITLAQSIAEARTDIINLVAQLETSAANMQQLSLAVNVAQRSYELTEESFSRGIVQRLDVEDSQNAFRTATQQYLLSQYQYLAGLIELRQALGLETLEELLG